jgi:hypothetical protein
MHQFVPSDHCGGMALFGVYFMHKDWWEWPFLLKCHKAHVIEPHGPTRIKMGFVIYASQLA